MDQTQHTPGQDTEKLQNEENGTRKDSLSDSLPSIDQAPLTPLGHIDDDDAESAAAYQSLLRHRKERRRKKIVHIAIVAGIVAAVALFLAARSLFPNNGGSGGPSLPTEVVYRDDFRETISGTGSAKPREQVTVATGLEGEVLSIDVAVGDTVSEDQILMSVKNDSLDKAVDEAWFAYKDAEAAEDAAQEALNAVWYGSDQAAKDSAYIALKRAELATESAYAAYEAAVKKAEDRTVRAPIAGTVISLGGAVVGQQLGPAAGGEGQSSTSTGIQLADLSQMSIVVQVSEIDISKVKVGQTATVTFSALPNVVSDAVVSEIATLSSSGDGNYYGGGGNVTYAVTLLIENPDPQLKPGMTASVSIDVQYIPGALCVSTSALMTDDGETYYLLVVTDPATGKTEQRFVTVLAESSTTAAIEGDIAEGDEVQSGVGWTGSETETGMSGSMGY